MVFVVVIKWKNALFKRSIAGVNPQNLQLQTQVTLARLSCPRSVERENSHAGKSVCCCYRCGGDASGLLQPRDWDSGSVLFVRLALKVVMKNEGNVVDVFLLYRVINHLTPNCHYMGRNAQLTSRCCILYIYSTNIRTEYFKRAA